MEKLGMTERIWNSTKNFLTFFGSDPKIIPCLCISSMADNPCEGDETLSDEEDAARSEALKKKRKRKLKSSASEMIEFLNECKEDKQKE